MPRYYRIIRRERPTPPKLVAEMNLILPDEHMLQPTELHQHPVEDQVRSWSRCLTNKALATRYLKTLRRFRRGYVYDLEIIDTEPAVKLETDHAEAEALIDEAAEWKRQMEQGPRWYGSGGGSSSA